MVQDLKERNDSVASNVKDREAFSVAGGSATLKNVFVVFFSIT
jgi:hypothetical protein